MVKVAISGFGRIGRLAFRIGLLKHMDDLEFVAINTSGSMDVGGWAHLVNYDTTYRKFDLEVTVQEVRSPSEVTDQDSLIGYLQVRSRNVRVPVFAQRDPTKLPWDELGVDVVIESTGQFTDEQGAKKHMTAGAKRVVISAPVKGGNIPTYVLGVKDYPSSGEVKEVISNASCTTNCVSPVAAVMMSNFGVAKAMMTTIHAYTEDQRLQDGSHHDLRRARAAAANIVPTTTGAAIAATETIPSLRGLFDGVALRVPVISGSITDFVFVTKKMVQVDEVNEAFREAASLPLYSGILGVSEKPLVSSDIIGTPQSAIVDLSLTQVIDGDLVKVMAWYDNEWAYSCRLVEQTIRVGKTTGSIVPTDPLTSHFLVPV